MYKRDRTQKGVGKGFSHVVGVTGSCVAARGASPLWKSAKADLFEPLRPRLWKKRLLFIAAFFVDFYFLVTTCF
jgi:hypothetical protein